MKKRILSMITALAMCLSMLPAYALAVENPDTDGLCEHHPEHTAECGYTEGAESTLCTFVCEVCNLPNSGETEPEDNIGGFEELPDLANGGVNLLANQNSYDIGDGPIEIDNSCGGSCAGHTITGTSTENTITVTGGTHNIILNNVRVDVDYPSSAGICAFSIENGATVNLTLEGTNTLNSGDEKAGLQVPAGTELTITKESTGSLVAEGSVSGAGIGSGRYSDAGTIIINGGTVTAQGGGWAAGIGGGNDGGASIITINGGTVIAKSSGTGIGGGYAHNGGIITINDGTVTAQGGQFGAGIGSGEKGTGGTVIINGGNVTADGSISGGGHGSGIGGGDSGGGVDIIITGGIVTATSSRYGSSIGNAGIGSGGYNSVNCNITITGGTVIAQGSRNNGAGISGTFTTTGSDNQPGNAFLIANGINNKDSQGQWSGVIIENGAGKVYGNPTLAWDATIPSGTTVTIPESSTLTIGDFVTLTNNGTITGQGTLTGNGTLTGSGTVTVKNNEALKDSKVEISFNPAKPVYNDSVTITATVSRATNRAVANNVVSFYVGSIADGNKLNNDPIAVSNNGEATLTIFLSGEKWKPGDYTILAEYSGSLGLKPENGTSTLTVAKAANSVFFLDCADIVFGERPNPHAWAERPESNITYTYSNQENGTYGAWNKGNAVGTWYVKASVAATEYYDAAEGVVAFQVTTGGTVTVDPGESITVGGSTITNNDGKITITEGGTTTTITPSDGVTVNEDGTVNVPGGSAIKTGDNGPEITVGPGNGGTVGGDGTITVPDGGSVQVGDEPTTITPPSGGAIKPNPDGTVDVSDGSTIQTGDDGPEITVGPGNGGTVGGDGTVTVPDGGSVQVGNDPTTITPPSGGEIKPNPDGSVSVPDGSTVQTGDDGPEITVGPGNGGKVDEDGSITLPGGGKVTVEPDDTIITLPGGGGTITPNPGGTVDVPDGSTIQTGDGNQEIKLPEGGTIGSDGNITVPEDGTIQIGKDPATVITPPKGGEVTSNPNGTVSVPDGSTIKSGDNGPEITVGPGNGGTVGGDGSITIPGGGTVTVEPDTTITLPGGGGTITPDPDGNINLPGGSTIEKDGNTTTVPDTGGSYDPDTGDVIVNVHTVTFDSQGGSAVSSVIVTDGKKVARPSNPTKSGYTFGGWYKDSGCTSEWKFDTDTVTSNITLYAKWTQETQPSVKYSVTVNGSYATVSGAGSYEAGATVSIDAGSRSNYRFNGWTTSDGVTFANAASASTTFVMPGKAVTVTANWTYTGGSSGGGGGGGYTPPTYPPTVEKPSEGGDVTIKPSRPSTGDKVTVQPKPDTGYEVDQITVTDKNGKPVKVTQNPDGTYTFTQPSGKVTIQVAYKPVETPWNNPFTDVSEHDWYYEAVRFVHERGLMGGYGNGLFGSNNQLSRAQLAQILFNKEGRPGVNYLMDFSDVAGEAWYTEAVRWAAAMGIVGGYGDGRFGPNDPITREQLAVMLWRYAGSPAATNKELHFADVDKISGYALEALRWAVGNNILNGYGDGQLGPQGQATRAQVAQMLTNFFEN